MTTTQWPLSAAATSLLLALPAPDAKPRRLSPDTEPVKLALKELLVRGAFAIQVEPRRRGHDRVTLVPGQSPAGLPLALSRLDAALRPQVPGEIKEVVKAARARDPLLIKDIGQHARDELLARGLIAEHEVKRLGLIPARVWGRTASGDAWATAGAQHLERLGRLEDELREHPDSGSDAAMAAGALAVMVPGAMGPIARERRRRNEAGPPYLYPVDGGGAHGTGEGSFDIFGGVGDLLDSVLDGGMNSLDQGIDAVDGALDSVAGSIDGAIDSGVDAGGGDGGGDGGGGGGG